MSPRIALSCCLLLLTGCPTPTGGRVEARIDASGGSLTVGQAVLTIPEGALSEPVTLSVEVAEAPAPSEYEGLSPVYVFGPAGTRFDRPVEVTLEFAAGAERPVLFWSKAEGPGFDRLPGTVAGNRLTGLVTHFSSGFVGETPPDALELSTSHPYLPLGETARVEAWALFPDAGERVNATDRVAWRVPEESGCALAVDGGEVLITGLDTQMDCGASAALGDVVGYVPMVVVPPRAVAIELRCIPDQVPIHYLTDCHPIGIDADGGRWPVSHLPYVEGAPLPDALISLDPGVAQVVSDGFKKRILTVDAGTARIQASYFETTAEKVLQVEAGWVSELLVFPSAPVLNVGESVPVNFWAVVEGSPLGTAGSGVYPLLLPHENQQVVRPHLYTLNGVDAGTDTVSYQLGPHQVDVAVTVTSATLQSLEAFPSTLELAPGERAIVSVTGHFSDGTSAELGRQLVWSYDLDLLYVDTQHAEGVSVSAHDSSGGETELLVKNSLGVEVRIPVTVVP